MDIKNKVENKEKIEKKVLQVLKPTVLKFIYKLLKFKIIAKMNFKVLFVT